MGINVTGQAPFRTVAHKYFADRADEMGSNRLFHRHT
jgi:hypothetical protein